MASTMVNCGICGLGVRFPGDQPAPAGVVCESPACQAELKRTQTVNAPDFSNKTIKVKGGK